MDQFVDWNQMWKEAQELRRRSDDAGYWDKRAPSFAKTAGTSPYARTFLERAKLVEGDTVFDMGCGSGTLALPLARAGYEVYAADFSSVMIEIMMKRAVDEGIEQRIHTINLSWDEDWDARDLPICDVAFASRSIATGDMQRSLERLDSRARRRVCVTFAAGESPREDEVLLEVMGRKRTFYPDYVFGMNILWSMGILPDLSYIVSARDDEFESFDEAIEKTCTVSQASPEERERLVAYAKEHLLLHEHDDGSQGWAFDHVRKTVWAFASWDK
ncbi:MAG: class I SAM-dependent methyltransferase [Coriobacteriales bacterium]|jgi:SAM-dependent methyltransferase